jgi:hypothetical protein
MIKVAKAQIIQKDRRVMANHQIHFQKMTVFLHS